MKLTTFGLTLAICMCFVTVGLGGPDYTDQIAVRAVSAGGADATLAIRELRAMGPVGLDVLL